MTLPDHLQISRRRLKIIRLGFTGLYYCNGNDSCGCSTDDFAPCGNRWSVVRDCKPGYHHVDPRPGKNIEFTSSKPTATIEEFENFE